MRRVVQDGHRPRPLQEKATRKSWPQSSQDPALQVGAQLALDVAVRRKSSLIMQKRKAPVSRGLSLER
jgi:hypothetical protein